MVAIIGDVKILGNTIKNKTAWNVEFSDSGARATIGRPASTIKLCFDYAVVVIVSNVNKIILGIIINISWIVELADTRAKAPVSNPTGAVDLCFNYSRVNIVRGIDKF